MNVHKNAVLTPRGREILISRLERGEHPNDVAAAMGVSVSTVYKWRRRNCAEGLAGLRDRTSPPPMTWKSCWPPRWKRPMMRRWNACAAGWTGVA